MFELAIAALVGAQAIGPVGPAPAVRQDLVMDLAPRSILRADIVAGSTPEELSGPATGTLVSELLNDHRLTLAAHGTLLLVAAPGHVAAVPVSVLTAAREDRAGR
jgi:hypothetical protein